MEMAHARPGRRAPGCSGSSGAGLVIHTCRSRSGTPIRLTSERWEHITQGHPELAGMLYLVLEAVETAESIHEGADGESLAMKHHAEGKKLVVVYREGDTDGFIITAFLTRRARSITRRKKIWPT